MQKITFPKRPRIIKEKDDWAIFEIKPCFPGYGTTLGNSLRRVLLSSLSGSAITAVKINKASHEFSAIDGIMEDVVEIIFNLKQIKFKMHGDEPVVLSLNTKGEKKVTAADIKAVSGVEVMDKKAHIASLTNKNSRLEMEIKVEKGIGYSPIEQRKENQEMGAGTIEIDAVFTPIKKVNYEIEKMRVGEMTNYDKLTLELETDGSISPEEAFKQATKLLVDHFNLFNEPIRTISEIEEIENSKEKAKKSKEEKEIADKKEKEKEEEEKIKKEEARKKENHQEDVLKLPIEELELSPRTKNALSNNKIKTISNLVRRNEENINDLEGMGEKGIKEIKKALGKLGLVLKERNK